MDADEEAMARIILEKLSQYHGLSYAEVAKTAFLECKTKLATMASNTDILIYIVYLY
jgi:hypothetical protein